ncbi:GGDEF domain-containing protein [Acanthopleuribacter pedis]|uniref:diguanylate cyclase n=1 Tax=Acanthopleuribacter pedis TaxID=442870 RepID=A0A8J7U4F7_9BACT|nr:GGDEF domain-containing protein [Acanthopleuribacter pedis]MBO1319754.1 GGDEF domain-containing protein [Acanthopleuribacter pedis]
MKPSESVYQHELEIQRRAEVICQNPPEQFEELLKEYLGLTQHYTKLLKNTIKLTSVGDGAQRKLVRARNDLLKAKRRLEDASFTDALTGVRNRRFLLDFIDNEVKSVLNNDSELGDHNLLFLMIDIDHFKQVNDTYGHPVGDTVLVQFSNLVSAACRKSDTLVRWGGEEFLVVCRDSDQAYPAKLAERLRSQVEQNEFDIGEGRVLKCSCSIGFAGFPFYPPFPGYFGWSQIIDMADQALYIAKKSGRNAWVGVQPGKQVHHGATPPTDYHLKRLYGDKWVQFQTSLGDDARLVF